MSDSETTQLKVKYEKMSAKYASQCILNSTKEEILLDFSSGVVPDPATGQPVVPVHTRIAMSMSGAVRLKNLLDQAIAKAMSQAQSQAAPKAAPPSTGSRPKVTTKSTKKKAAAKKSEPKDDDK